MREKSHYSRIYIISVITIVLFIALLITMLVNRMLDNRSFITDSSISKLEMVNELAESSMENYISKIDLALKTADQWLVSNPGSDPRVDDDFFELINLFESDMSGMIDIRLISKTGDLFYLPSESPVALANLSGYKYFSVQQNIDTKGLYISDPLISHVTYTWRIPISYPLTIESHGINVIFASIDIPTLDSILKPFQMHQDGTIMLVRADGIVLAAAPFDENIIGKSLASYDIWEDKIVGNYSTTVFKSSELGDDNRYIVSRKVGTYPLYIISTCEIDAVLAPWRDTVSTNIIGIFLLVSFFIILGIIMLTLLRRLDIALNDITILSNTDALTGLYNRRYFDDVLREEIARASRYNGCFSLAIIDIDNFKMINDAYGHDIGDYLLRKLSQIVKENIRTSDVIVRWGGEEFVILFINANLTQAVSCSEKLRILIENSDFGSIGMVTASFGVVEYHQGENVESLLVRADKLMYISKNNGRNRVTSEDYLSN